MTNSKQIRLNNNLSLRDLEALSGIPCEVIQRLEDGVELPHLKQLDRLSSCLNVSNDEYVKSNNNQSNLYEPVPELII